ncbi:hypothetical protein [Blautia wexlerae]|uniref:hypothetical protein n=1 Tax=Blautia wexlerae TaxID=418240 RepID=UPI0018AC4A34|nr:hypothetical protein [Blautia wexlerae]MDB6437533.1 hypothetical protein [Blautia wexlerae]
MNEKSRNNIYCYFIISIITFLMFCGLMIVNVKAATGFTQNDNGEYEIWDSNGFNDFKNQIIIDGEDFNNQIVVLKNDISIKVNESADDSNWPEFDGEFDGQNHTINYSTDQFEKGKEIFPFDVEGTIKNLKVNMEELQLDNDNEFNNSLLVNEYSECSLIGIEVTGTVNVNITNTDNNIYFTVFDSMSGKIRDCSSGVNFDINASQNTLNSFKAYLNISEFGNTPSATRTEFINCFSYGTYNNTFINQLPNNRLGTGAISIVPFADTSDGRCTFTNCYYDNERFANVYFVDDNKVYDKKLISNLKGINQSCARTTEQMHSQDTYEGFDFDKYWEISADKNNGYPYYSPREVIVTLDVKPVITEKKVWNTETPKDQNKYGKTNTYYYPYVGDTSVKIDHFEFANVTAKQQNLIDTYGVTPDLNVSDIKSANVEMSYLGNRPVTITWKDNTTPSLTVTNAVQAKEDGYVFRVNVLKGTCEVVDNGDKVAHTDDWYYQKAQDAINLILKGGSYDVDNPCWNDNNIWFVFTAARCHYYPNGDKQYFDKWFVNTKKKLQEMKDNGVELDPEKYNVYQKLVFTIEAIGYDPRDIDSYDLLEFISQPEIVNSTNYLAKEYTIHALKAVGYESKNFTNADMDKWAHEKAAGIDKTLTQSEDGEHPLDNSDNFMAWQTLLYWYNKSGFEDVTNVINKSFEAKYVPMQVQRATGALCTAAYEQTDPNSNGIDGNNAWNDAQGLLYATTYDRDILNRDTGFIKNGNTILDATFDLINFETGAIPGFFWYDPAQIARGLEGYVRSYQRIHLKEDTTVFWDFSDVKVPTKNVNDLILALDANSTKEQIQTARDAYEDLLPKYKAIFNKDTLRKLLEAENGKGDSITKVIAAIDALPAADKLTLEDKDAVIKARNLYDALDDESKTVISNYSKLTEAEAKIKELEKQQEQKEKDKAAAEKVIAAIDALPSADNLTLNPYVLQLLDNIQAQYNALTEAQKALVANYSVLQTLRSLIPDLKAAAAVVDKINAIGEVTSDNYQKKQALVIEARTAYDALTADQKKRVTNYAELEKAELFIRRQSTDAKVGYVISFIDELNITTSSTGALSDGPLKLTEKNNNVPTEKIWNSWKDYVANARVLYNTLDDQQKAQVTNLSSLEKAEGYLYQLKSDALKAMLKALPDAETVRAYEAPQPTTVPAAQEAVQSEELPAQEVPAEGSDFSDGSADAFTSDISEQPAAQMDIQSSEDIADVSNEETPDSVIADEAEVPDADFSTEEEIPAAGDTAKRALTETELKQIAAAKNAYDQLTETEETKFRSENTALVENMEKLIAMALTYEKGQNEYQQLFADEAALIYATVKDHPVDRDSYPQVKAFLDRYAKDYQGQENAMAGLKVKVGNQEMTFAEVIAALTAQADKAGKDISDAQQADDWISNLPTAVTKENIAGVEAELAALQKLIDSMSAEGKSYMWNAKQLELIKTIVADYHIELAGKQDAFKADMPANLQTKALNYKTIQVSWSSVDNADGYIVYRRTETGSWKKIADQVTDIFYKDQKAVTGRVYYYTVRAYSYTWGGKTVSSYNKDGVIGKATLGKVKIATAASENYNTIRVTWNKVFGANGYRVYRSTSKNGKYTSIGSTAKNSAVTFLDKKAVTGTTYYYKVRAYRNVNGKKVYGSYSIAVKGKAVLSAPSLSVGSTSKTAVLEWSRVKAADGYQVYASASKNGKYTRIKTTKGTGMTEEKLATGKTRYYKVRAYRKVNGKTVYGSFSKVKKVVIK